MRPRGGQRPLHIKKSAAQPHRLAAHVGPAEPEPRPHVAQGQLHRLGLGLGKEEPRPLQFRFEMIGQFLDLDALREIGVGQNLVRHLAPQPAPFVCYQKHGLAEVERVEIRVHRHGDDGVGAGDILVFEPRALGAEQDRDLAPSRRHLAGLLHRPLGAEHRLGQLAPARGGGENIVAIGDRLGQRGEHSGGIKHPPGTGGERRGFRIGPAITRLDEAHPVEAEVQHRARRRADVLAHLGPHQHDRRRHLV